VRAISPGGANGCDAEVADFGNGDEEKGGIRRNICRAAKMPEGNTVAPPNKGLLQRE